MYGLVRQHDGFVDVASRPGEGTNLTVYLPAVERNQPSDPVEGREALPLGAGQMILAKPVRLRDLAGALARVVGKI